MANPVGNKAGKQLVQRHVVFRRRPTGFLKNMRRQAQGIAEPRHSSCKDRDTIADLRQNSRHPPRRLFANALDHRTQPVGPLGRQVFQQADLLEQLESVEGDDL